PSNRASTRSHRRLPGATYTSCKLTAVPPPRFLVIQRIIGTASEKPRRDHIKAVYCSKTQRPCQAALRRQKFASAASHPCWSQRTSTVSNSTSRCFSAPPSQAQ